MEQPQVEIGIAELRSKDLYKTRLDRDYNWGPNEYFQENGACTQTPAIAAEFQAVFDLEAERQTQEVRQQLKDQEALAKAICQSCGVLKECFDYVMPRNQRMFHNGVFAGLNSEERRKLVTDKDNPIPQLKPEGLRVRGHERPKSQSEHSAA